MFVFRKKRNFLAIILAICFLFLFVGCSGFVFDRAPEPTMVCLEKNADVIDSPMQRANASVVSIVSIGYVRSMAGFGTIVQVSSGLLVNSEGYVLSLSDAYSLSAMDESGKTYQTNATTVFAVFSQQFQTRQHFRLDLVDCDQSAGLALFHFYDRFYYYEDSAKTEQVHGIEDYVIFSTKSVQTGNDCFAFGNSLGNILNDFYVPSQMQYFDITASKGVIANDRADPKYFPEKFVEEQSFSSFLVTSSVNYDMNGGGLFDENGYLIGVLASKLVSDNASGDQNSMNYTYYNRLAQVYRGSHAMAYIDFVSKKMQITIPYTIGNLSTEAEFADE